jgi:tight adherence protein B
MAGIAGFLSAATAAATVLFLIDSSLTGRRRRTDLSDLIAGLRLLARELRSGAAPPVAAAHAAAAARGVAATVLAELATGGGASVTPGDTDPLAEIRTRLTAGWELASRQGLAITPMIDAVVLDASERLAADSERAGQVAGPRVSGYVMAALPVMGLLLGAGMGADPVQVLARSGIGNVLLVVGVTLTCAGLLWSARIVRP